MLATVDIKHPKAKDYTKQEIEKIILELINNYLEEDNEVIELTPIDYEDLSEEARKKLDLLEQMTPEERRKKYFNFSL